MKRYCKTRLRLMGLLKALHAIAARHLMGFKISVRKKALYHLTEAFFAKQMALVALFACSMYH